MLQKALTGVSLKYLRARGARRIVTIKLPIIHVENILAISPVLIMFPRMSVKTHHAAPVLLMSTQTVKTKPSPAGYLTRDQLLMCGTLSGGSGQK
jgi:hypothetical protein